MRLVRLPGRHRRGERLEPHRRPRARLSGDGLVQARRRPPKTTGRGRDHDQGNRLPCLHQRPHTRFCRKQWLLVAQQLHGRRAARRILGLPRARCRHRSFAAAQVPRFLGRGRRRFCSTASPATCARLRRGRWSIRPCATTPARCSTTEPCSGWAGTTSVGSAAATREAAGCASRPRCWVWTCGSARRPISFTTSPSRAR